MKSNLLFLFLAISLITNAQNWQFVGQPEFTNVAISARLAFSPTGDPYVVYQDAETSNRTRVVTFDGVNWQDLGTVSSLAADSESIAFNPSDNSIWVAQASTSTRQTFLYRYDGSNWQARTLTPNTSQNRYNKHLGLHYEDNFGNPVMSIYSYPAISATSGFATSIERYSNSISSNIGGQYGSQGAAGRNNTVAVDKYGSLITNRTNDDVFTSDFRLNGNTFSGFSGKIISQQAKHYDLIKDRWIAHTRDFGATTDVLQFFIGTSKTTNQPLGTPNSQGEMVSIDMDSNNTAYLLYANSNDRTTLEKYTSGSWSQDMLFPSIPTTSTGYFQQIAVNDTTDEVYFMFRDVNNKISLMKFIPPALPILYVDADATGNDSGDSWANAFTNLNQALANFQPGVTNEVWLAEGTYRTSANVTNGFTFAEDGMTIYGGFNGTETALSQRDVRAHETIFSGDASNNDTGVDYGTATRDENARRVVYINANDVILDGITIADGHADGTTVSTQIGAGIYINPSKINFTLQNATVKNNVSFQGGTLYYWPETSGTITIQNCIFRDNLGRYASTAYIVTDPGVNLVALMLNNLFHNNEVKNRGSIAAATADLWIRALGNGSTISTNILNNTFTNFSSNGTNSSNAVVHAPLVLSQDSGNHISSVTNTIIYGNNVIAGQTLFDISGRSSGSVANVINVTNSIGEEGFSLASSTTNTLGSDPLFVDAGNGNLRLSNGSPAIDAGDNSFLTTGSFSVTNDLDFNPRIFNTTVDIGAFEFDPAALGIEDFNTSNSLSLYPNPAIDTVTINSNNEIQWAVIYNQLGQIIKRSTSKTIDVSLLKSGIYIIDIRLKNGLKETSKLIIK